MLHVFFLVFLASCTSTRNMMNPKIGTAYASAYDVNLGDYFSRCFDRLNSCTFIDSHLPRIPAKAARWLTT